MSHRTTRVVAIVLFIMFLAGCAARPGDPPTIDRLRPFLRLAVTLGTSRILTESPKVAPVVLQVTTTLMTLFDRAELVVPTQIDAVIRAKILAMNLTPDVQAIIEALLASVVMELRLVIDQLELSDRQVTVLAMELVGWIHTETLRHVQMPPARIGRH